MKELKTTGTVIGDLVAQNQFILQAINHHRLIRQTDLLKLEILPNQQGNPICNFFNTEDRLCHCKASAHYNKYCSFSFWFADCIQYRGPNGELPGLYELYNKRPDDFEILKGEVKPAHIKK